jgi:hypothetical protein
VGSEKDQAMTFGETPLDIITAAPSGITWVLWIFAAVVVGLSFKE